VAFAIASGATTPDVGRSVERRPRSSGGEAGEGHDVYPVDSFPSFDVYGATARPELRLMTCGGAYARTAGPVWESR
jgi:hypothetical protein